MKDFFTFLIRLLRAVVIGGVIGAVISYGIIVPMINAATTTPVESLKKPDSRTMVESPEGAYQAIVHLTLNKSGGKVSTCTGFVVAPRAVLTNRHCLTDTLSVVVKSGLKDVEGVTYIFAALESTDFRVSKSGQDYGVIFLPRPLLTEPFILQEFPQNAESTVMVTAGYPGDKDYFTQWESKYHGFVSIRKKEVLSGGVAAGGQSGSPLFQIEGNRFVAKGILWGHTGCSDGICPREQVTYFVPFTDTVLEEIREWIK